MHKNISLDGGALTDEENKQYGNYVFTTQLLRAIGEYDTVNKYTAYLLDKVNINFPNNIAGKVLSPKKGWLKVRISTEEIVKPKSVFLALNQALPIYTPARKIAFCHGLAPLYFPKLYPDSAAKLNLQVINMLQKADYIIISSKIIKEQFIQLFSLNNKEKNKLITLPYGFFPLGKQEKRYKKKKVLLYVGSNHPIKNSRFALDSFLKLKDDPKYNQYKLILIGINKHELSPRYRQNSEIIALGHQPHHKLSKFYQEAECLLTTSLYESFNFPILEALIHNTPVVALKSAVIPELMPFVQATEKEQYQDAIKSTLTQPNNIDLNALKRIFNWENYIKSLISLYES